MSRYFWPILTPPPLSHIPGPPKKYVTHPGPPIFIRPGTNNPDKSPLCKFSLNCLQGVLSEGLLFGRFCPGWFFPFPLLSECICYNRKLEGRGSGGLMCMGEEVSSKWTST